MRDATHGTTAKACRDAAERLEIQSLVNITSSSVESLPFQNTNTNAAVHIVPAYKSTLARMLRETADEFDMWANGEAALICPHCYDLGNVARLVMDLPPIDYESDES